VHRSQLSASTDAPPGQTTEQMRQARERLSIALSVMQLVVESVRKTERAGLYIIAVTLCTRRVGRRDFD
jgi:hypothetical protein